METKIDGPLDSIKDFAKEKTHISLDKMEDVLKKYELEHVHYDFSEKMSFLVMVALGIITAVSWDQVLKMVTEHIFNNLSDDMTKVIYAIFVTIVTVIVSIVLNKLFIKHRKQKVKKTLVEILRDVIGE